MHFVVCFRALIIRAGEIIPMSSSFTPESERQRIQFLVREIWISHRILILVNSVYSLVVFCSAAGLGEWFSRTRMFVCILSRTKSPIMEHVCGFTQEDSSVFPFVSFSPRLTCSRHCWETSSRTWSFPEGSRKKRSGRECCTETSQ